MKSKEYTARTVNTYEEYECIDWYAFRKTDIERFLSWMAKFCRHIDNEDKQLTDEENLEFFKQKLKAQFGFELEEEKNEE